MKGFFLDFLLPRGHKYFSESILNSLGSFSKVKVYTSKGYYEDEKIFSNSIEVITDKDLIIEKGWFKSRLSSLKIILKSAKLVNQENFDYCIVSSFDTISFLIGYMFFKKKERIYLIHHNNVDGLLNKFKKLCFKLYMNKVNHIVLEEYIKQYLIDLTNVDTNRVFTIPHPLPHSYERINNCNEFLFSGCALSNSNDEALIDSLLQCEKEKQIFKKHNAKLILKSKTNEYDNGYLKLVSGFIKRKDYDFYIQKSRFILLPFSKTYQYRTSGVLIDALSNHKQVIGTDVPLMRFYKSKYPSLCYIYRDNNELLDLCNQEIDSYKEEDYQKFLEAHSEDSMKNQLITILSRE